MAYKFHFDWDVNVSEGSCNYTDKVYRLYSKQFSGSPDEIAHYWTVCLSHNPSNPDNYGIWVNLDDKPFHRRISMKFTYKAFDSNFQLLGEGSSGFHKFEQCAGIGQFLDCSLVGEMNNIKSIGFDIELQMIYKSSITILFDDSVNFKVKE